MTWEQTHRRWRAMRAIEEQLADQEQPRLPWNDELAELFGDPSGLVTALRYRWQLTLDTQLDTHLPEAVLAEQRAQLEQRGHGVRRALAAWAETTAAPSDETDTDPRRRDRAVA